MTVLLTTINSKYIHLNLAIGLLYELNKNFEGLHCKEFGSKTDIDEMVDYCSSFDVVAFSCYIWNITRILEVARQIKKVNPGCSILLGGPEVSYDWEDVIAKPEVDFIIKGEGEIPFSSFLQSYSDLSQVPSLIWKKDGLVMVNKAAEGTDLELFNNINPYQSISVSELKHKICYIEASRGCPNCCEFCLAGLENKVRNIPFETIQANLLYLMEHGRVIKFLDRTFNTNQRFAISIFRFILENHKPGTIFQFEIKADIHQEDLIAFIRERVPPGIFRFEIGIQTLNTKSNLEVKRRQNFEKIKNFIEQISEKIEIHLDLIVGLPYDYMADIIYSFEEVFKLFAPELQLGFLKFLKGTPIRANYREHNYRFDSQPPYQIIDSKYLSVEEIDKMLLVEHSLDTYWNKKRTTHTLKYVALNYSIFDFLYGLGLYWKEKNGLRNTGLTEIYTIIYEYAVDNYSGDFILRELIALDYFLAHKIKPGNHFLPEIEKGEKVEIIERLKLNHHKYRYILHRVHFSIQKLVNEGIVEPETDLLIIEYSGVERPRIILNNC